MSMPLPVGPPPGAPPPAPAAPPAMPPVPAMPPPQGYFQPGPPGPMAAPLLLNQQHQTQMVPSGALTLATQPPPVSGRQRIQGSTMVAITK